MQSLAIFPSIETLTFVVGQPCDASIVVIRHLRVRERGSCNGTNNLYTWSDDY